MATIPINDNYLQALGEKYKRLKHQINLLDKTEGKPGKVVSIIKNFGPVIQTGEGLLLLSEFSDRQNVPSQVGI